MRIRNRELTNWSDPLSRPFGVGSFSRNRNRHRPSILGYGRYRRDGATKFKYSEKNGSTFISIRSAIRFVWSPS